jgi:hypothetical protein
VNNVWNTEHLRVTEISDMNNWRWTEDAACRGTDPDSWFETDTILERERLRAICEACPVASPCLNQALAHNERGFWGGMSRGERNQILGRYVRG